MELSRLTRYELELMDVLWQRGEGTVQEVCDQLGRPLAYTTVMTTLRLLHSKKKVLKRVKRSGWKVAGASLFVSSVLEEAGS